MLQRVGLAQAIVHDPRLVILDEPTAGVDPLGAIAITELILELKRRGKTVLLCSHLLAQVEDVCDHLVILNQGKLVAEGAVGDLLRREGLSNLAVESLPTPAMQAEVEARRARTTIRVQGRRRSVFEAGLAFRNAWRMRLHGSVGRVFPR